MFDETRNPPYNLDFVHFLASRSRFLGSARQKMYKVEIMLLMKKMLPFFLIFSLLLLLWECICWHFADIFFVLPAPSMIFSTLWELRAHFWLHASVTLKEMLLGFFFALTLAFPLAWTMLRYSTTRSLLQPLFVIIQCVPMFALAPIMVVLFGWTEKAIIIPTALMIFFPLTLNIYQGLRATPRPLLEYFAVNQATAWQTLTKLRLPFALPHIFAGLRISAAIAGMGAVAGEWAGAQRGLGVLMLESRRNLDLEITFGALFCLTLMSILLYSCVVLIERIPCTLHFEWRGRLLKRKPSVVALLALFLLVSCGREEKQTRLLLDWLPNANHIPLYVGIEKGFFADEGIHLHIQKMFESGGGIGYLTSHQADLAISHLPSTLKASSKGAKLTIIGQLIDSSLRALIYLRDDRVVTPSDLSGKIFGYCIGGPDTSFIDYMLSTAAIKPIDRKNVSTDMIAPMGTGAVDFIYGGYWNVEPHLLRSLGVETSYFTFDELKLPQYHELIVIANAHSEESRPDFVHRFQRALQRSIDFSKQKPEEAFHLYQKCTPDKSKRTVTWEWESWKETLSLLCDNQEIDFDVVESYYHWQLEREIVHDQFDYYTLQVRA